jgi:phosphate transport system substrate-binding protein
MLARLNIHRPFTTLSALAIAASLAACNTGGTDTATAPQTGTGTDTAGESVNASLSGAGATFPAPLYQRWFSEYNKENPGVQISYQSVGSGAGVKQYLARTVDFGASDAPLTDEERQEFQSKYNAEPIQVPMTGGAVVMAYNLGGEVQNIRLSRQAFCGIVNGEITQWNAPEIAQTNEGVNLPNQPITFVHRSDGSGTTFIFTNHVQAACPTWKAGAAKSVSWPTGIGAKGNEGVTAQIQQTQGAVGYVEYAYANENNLSMAALENQAGEIVEPSPESASVALEGQEIPEDYALEVPDPTAKEAYPIVGLTWLLLYPQYDDASKLQALKNFIPWAYNQGDQYAQELGYIAVPDEISERVVSQTLPTIETAFLNKNKTAAAK